MEFNEKLQNLRKEKGLSQEEIDHILGVTRQTVSKWELESTSYNSSGGILSADDKYNYDYMYFYYY